MATQRRYYVRYNGPLESVVLEGHGHFTRGESKHVDYLTACGLRDDAAQREGWEVSDEPFKDPDEETSHRARRRDEDE